VVASWGATPYTSRGLVTPQPLYLYEYNRYMLSRTAFREKTGKVLRCEMPFTRLNATSPP